MKPTSPFVADNLMNVTEEMKDLQNESFKTLKNFKKMQEYRKIANDSRMIDILGSLCFHITLETALFLLCFVNIAETAICQKQPLELMQFPSKFQCNFSQYLQNKIKNQTTTATITTKKQSQMLCGNT